MLNEYTVNEWKSLSLESVHGDQEYIYWRMVGIRHSSKPPIMSNFLLCLEGFPLEFCGATEPTQIKDAEETAQHRILSHFYITGPPILDAWPIPKIE